MNLRRKKPEDSAEGCRALALADFERATAMTVPHMRAILERSAEAWTRRAKLLERLEEGFAARLADNLEPAALTSTA